MTVFPDNWSAFTAALLVAQALALAGFWWWSRRFTAPGVGAFHLVVLAMAGRTGSEAVEWLFAATHPGVLLWALGIKCTLSSLLAAGLFLLFADVSGLNRWATPSPARSAVAQRFPACDPRSRRLPGPGPTSPARRPAPRPASPLPPQPHVGRGGT